MSIQNHGPCQGHPQNDNGAATTSPAYSVGSDGPIDVSNAPEPFVHGAREPREDADDLKSRIGLADLIRGEVKGIRLTRAGVNLVALCPLCGQKRTPSFYVYDDKRFHCHACALGGDHFK